MLLPPYGKALVEQRKKGLHPEKIWVLFGDDWRRRPTDHPSLCIKPSEYKKNKYKWLICSGYPVFVIDRRRHTGSREIALDLCEDIAIHTAPVYYCWIANKADWPYLEGKQYYEDISFFTLFDGNKYIERSEKYRAEEKERLKNAIRNKALS